MSDLPVNYYGEIMKDMIWFNSDGEFGQYCGWLVRRHGVNTPIERDQEYELADQSERTAMLGCIAELSGALKRIKDTAATHTEGAGMPEFEVYMNIAGEAGNALTRAAQFLKPPRSERVSAL